MNRSAQGSTLVGTVRRGADRGVSWSGDALGSMADLGVLLPIAVVLIVSNGLSATTVFCLAGAFYLLVALVYRAPVPVQPMKAFAALAIAGAMTADEIASGALVIGVALLVLGSTGVVDKLRDIVPAAVIRGVQLAVGLALLKIAWHLVESPASVWGPQPPEVLGYLVAASVACALVWRPRLALLLALVACLVIVTVSFDGTPAWGMAEIEPPHISPATLWTGLVVLVIPQLPLTITSSCLATADAMSHYYGATACRVTTGRLAKTVGVANVVVAAMSGMAMCHGSGGVTAHHRFGARTWRAPAIIGSSLVLVALLVGNELTQILSTVPLSVLAALIAVAGVAHMLMIRTLERRSDLLLALAIGISSQWIGLTWSVLAALALWWLPSGTRRLMAAARG